MTPLPTPASSPPPSSSSMMAGGNVQPTTPRSSSSVTTTTTMTTPSTMAVLSKGKKSSSGGSSSNSSSSSGGGGGGGVALNDEFLRQLIRLVRKLIPSWKTVREREGGREGGRKDQRKWTLAFLESLHHLSLPPSLPPCSARLLAWGAWCPCCWPGLRVTCG